MTERVIVADSSPLIGLARIGQLEILRKLASRILMPPAVRDEITLHSRDAPGAAAIRQATWIEIEAPDPLQVELFLRHSWRTGSTFIKRSSTLS